MGVAASKQEAFYDACGYNHKKRVEMFLAQGIDVNWVSYNHDSCAIHVASQGCPEIVGMLIAAKCDVNVKDIRGNLALHHAAMRGHADIMQLLINAGSEINVQDKNGWTSLINAAYWCQPEAAKVLLNNNCDVHLQNKDERTALHETCRSQSTDDEGLAELAQLLIEAGCDLNSKSSDVGEADFTPLMFSAYHGHVGVAKALMKAECDINAQGTNGWTALHWAADRGHREMVEVLLDGGVDPLIEAQRELLAADRSKDGETRELLIQATREAKALRDDCSGVDTTSPMSSSMESLSSIEDSVEQNNETRNTENNKDINNAEKESSETKNNKNTSSAENESSEDNKNTTSAAEKELSVKPENSKDESIVEDKEPPVELVMSDSQEPTEQSNGPVTHSKSSQKVMAENEKNVSHDVIMPDLDGSHSDIADGVEAITVSTNMSPEKIDNVVVENDVSEIKSKDNESRTQTESNDNKTVVKTDSVVSDNMQENADVQVMSCNDSGTDKPSVDTLANQENSNNIPTTNTIQEKDASSSTAIPDEVRTDENEDEIRELPDTSKPVNKALASVVTADNDSDFNESDIDADGFLEDME